jgi:hypothetical protein
MIGEKVCELCTNVIDKLKTNQKQTRYCSECAKVKKRENTFDPWTPEQRKQYMRGYMRGYRRKYPGLSTPYVQRHRKKKKPILATAS